MIYLLLHGVSKTSHRWSCSVVMEMVEFVDVLAEYEDVLFSRHILDRRSLSMLTWVTNTLL